MYLVFALIVAGTTYLLSGIANTPVYLGLVQEGFTSNLYNVPINVLLEGSGNVAATSTRASLSDLLYKACRDHTCASGFTAASNELWALVGSAFALIPEFDQPHFQNSSHIVVFQHINNLSGWNKASAQFHISGHDMAITCMVRRASFVYAGHSHPIVDSLAFCSQRPYDPQWVCETDVDVSVNTYAIQVRNGVAAYIGVTPRGEVYFNPNHVATFRGSALGAVALSTVPSINEYHRGFVQASAAWDVLVAARCKSLDRSTYLGWLLQCQGYVTMTWQCDSLMPTNAAVLLAIVLYLVLVQIVFLRQSHICCVPVDMSKHVIGVAILVVAFAGNENLQALTTYLYQNPSYGSVYYYAFCGPAQLASIVGIMTGTLVQMWFNPRLVTETWLLLVFSLLNWILVFVLEAYVFPGMSTNVPARCALVTTSNCIVFSAVLKMHFVSAGVAMGVVALAIVAVYVHSACRFSPPTPPTSVLTYFNAAQYEQFLTSSAGCVGERGADNGVLLIKSMLRVAPDTLTRTTNAPYVLLHMLLPTKLVKRLYSDTIGSLHVVHLQENAIGRTSGYKVLDKIEASSDTPPCCV
ncbi:hypothetical protein SPRG_00999 [Saprolegnia parasitica CBS 223.65]|uniref:Uncharacterized protein n=1 Tax=Saprolegnia parasitica (strain CBS 223.65) TaxID=695850 RepID=A0A067D7E8_SAPPC|nr:hypothetical protein SPRG_00999 [Saprolegnia parasitica CBS 223.65]KDO34937.1 hypothetical protein SPRG_00999 [Saprolegnia parasitica CBS 223.65]|eukprot:XP_012194593.1 hypothetical protein SPRG_00999 [Saprolegnia parasitica CBS 223.65]